MRLTLKRWAVGTFAWTIAVVAALTPAARAQSWGGGSFCQKHEFLCAENRYKYTNGQHIGHDEPGMLFDSSIPGSGNSMVYNLTLPKDPPKLPKQNGTGGTFNFQLHPAFWFGMAMCDTQSFPEFNNTTCAPDTDANIFDNSDPNAADYVGKHPGGAFLEMQFYPPGWVESCDGKHWCAALTIDSFNFDGNNNVDNNPTCLSEVGDEVINFAFITKSGVADSPADPLSPVLIIPNLKTDLLMNAGDSITINMHDTAAGLQVVVYDNTTHQQGSMTASIANQFAQVNFAPNDTTCTSTPYAFHPMYSTSGVHTRLPWLAHSFNVSFSDEIGHWDFCNSVGSDGVCKDPVKPDLTECFAPNESPRIKIGGCIDEDLDFDSVSYNNNWPGTNPATDAKFHPGPITFTSPLFNPTAAGGLSNYDIQAFENDMPAFEPACNTTSGTGCTNPPPGAAFYPFFSIGNEKSGACTWRFGGADVTGSTNDFGGPAQWGDLLALVYPDKSGPVTAFEDYQSTPGSNPCPAPAAALTLPAKPVAFGTVPQGKTSAVKLLKIANPGPFPITLAGLTLPSDYHVAASKQTTCPAGVLAPGAKCQYGLTLSPTVSGTENGQATLLGNASNTPATILLVGNGK